MPTETAKERYYRLRGEEHARKEKEKEAAAAAERSKDEQIADLQRQLHATKGHTSERTFPESKQAQISELEKKLEALKSQDQA